MLKIKVTELHQKPVIIAFEQDICHARPYLRASQAPRHQPPSLQTPPSMPTKQPTLPILASYDFCPTSRHRVASLPKLHPPPSRSSILHMATHRPEPDHATSPQDLTTTVAPTSQRCGSTTTQPSEPKEQRLLSPEHHAPHKPPTYIEEGSTLLHIHRSRCTELNPDHRAKLVVPLGYVGKDSDAAGAREW